MMKLVLMSPDTNLGWVMMSLNTGMLWLTPVGRGRREEGERREAHAVSAISGTLSYTHPHAQTPVTFDAVVVECLCHGSQSLLSCVTIGDQLGRQSKKY